MAMDVGNAVAVARPVTTSAASAATENDNQEAQGPAAVANSAGSSNRAADAAIASGGPQAVTPANSIGNGPQPSNGGSDHTPVI